LLPFKKKEGIMDYVDLQVGFDAPDFALTSDSGETIKLSDLKGKKVILYFYPKDDTPGCTKEACSFRDNLGVLQSKNVVVLGVSADSVESHKKFKQKYNLNFPLLSDEKLEVIKKYGVKKTIGIERSTFIIDEKGKIIKIYRNVKVDGHVEEIKKFLESN
jgi:peroxiredoxin Q/BCP